MLRLKQERLLRGWTETELAYRAGMHQSTISALESGAKTPWPGWRTRLSLLLGVPGDELFEEVDADE